MSDTITGLIPAAWAAQMPASESSRTVQRPVDTLAIMPPTADVGRLCTKKMAVMGALALGALAVGALAIGALAIGRLRILRADADRLHLGTVEIDDLTVKRLRVIDTADKMDGSNEA